MGEIMLRLIFDDSEKENIDELMNYLFLKVTATVPQSE